MGGLRSIRKGYYCTGSYKEALVDKINVTKFRLTQSLQNPLDKEEVCKSNSNGFVKSIRLSALRLSSIHLLESI